MANLGVKKNNESNVMVCILQYHILYLFLSYLISMKVKPLLVTLLSDDAHEEVEVEYCCVCVTFFSWANALLWLTM